MSTTTTKTPRNLRELWSMANELGLTGSELLADLERTLGECWFEDDSDITVSTASAPAPPAGFVQAFDAIQPDLPSDYFDGPTETGDGWQIETIFTFEQGVTFEILPPNGDYSKGGLTASQALSAGAALIALAAKYAATEPA